MSSTFGSRSFSIVMNHLMVSQNVEMHTSAIYNSVDLAKTLSLTTNTTLNPADADCIQSAVVGRRRCNDSDVVGRRRCNDNFNVSYSICSISPQILKTEIIQKYRVAIISIDLDNTIIRFRGYIFLWLSNNSMKLRLLSMV
ncbi:hypothetical protein RND81_13G116100 [Saponaria officinalis]|uniref:Uncharacterized protein n=1 Tax=Saponaria officinalis TaxID=3572 RepID=A0AAW1H4U6_SAPOF